MNFIRNERSVEDYDIRLHLLDVLESHVEIQNALEELNEAYRSYEIYSNICDCIKVSGGVTKSLEVMFGENFTNASSMEAEAEAEKKAWYSRVWEKIVYYWNKVVNFFKKVFSKEKVKKIENVATKINETVKEETKTKEFIPESCMLADLTENNDLYQVITESWKLYLEFVTGGNTSIDHLTEESKKISEKLSSALQKGNERFSEVKFTSASDVKKYNDQALSMIKELTKLDIESSTVETSAKRIESLSIDKESGSKYVAVMTSLASSMTKALNAASNEMNRSLMNLQNMVQGKYNKGSEFSAQKEFEKTRDDVKKDIEARHSALDEKIAKMEEKRNKDKEEESEEEKIQKEYSDPVDKGIANKDRNEVKAALIGYLDRPYYESVKKYMGGKKAREAEQKLAEVGIKLFDEDDGSLDLSKATLIKIKAALRLNFSKEKFMKGVELASF